MSLVPEYSLFLNPFFLLFFKGFEVLKLCWGSGPHLILSENNELIKMKHACMVSHTNSRLKSFDHHLMALSGMHHNVAESEIRGQKLPCLPYHTWLSFCLFVLLCVCVNGWEGECVIQVRRMAFIPPPCRISIMEISSCDTPYLAHYDSYVTMHLFLDDT